MNSNSSVAPLGDNNSSAAPLGDNNSSSSSSSRHAKGIRPPCAYVCIAVLLLCVLAYASTVHELRGALARLVSSSSAAAAHQQVVCPADFPTTPFPRSLWLVKTYKTGSSTLAGVFLTIASHYGIFPLKRDYFNGVHAAGPAAAFASARAASDAPFVALVAHHQYSEEVAALFGRQRPLLLTSVRHPLARVHSNAVQHLCGQTAKQLNASLAHCGGASTNTTFMTAVLAADTVEQRRRFAESPKQHNHLFQYIRGSAETVQAAADQFDFIFVSERMDEGLVAFMLENGLVFEDIAHLSIKNRTGLYRASDAFPAALNDYILSTNQQDLQLWQLANQRLDEAIIRLQERCGRDVFAAALATFRRLQAAVAAQCRDYESWYKAHGFSGPFSHVGDSGVGLRCVQHAARRFIAGLGDQHRFHHHRRRRQRQR